MARQLPIYFEENSEPLERRISVALHKLGLAMKQRGWNQANEDGLSPTQGQIIAALTSGGPLSGSELAEQLGVSLPTVSDSVRVLVDKGLLNKERDPRHPRATLLSLTKEGRAVAGRVSQWPDFMVGAVASLGAEEREVLLRTLIKMIHSLQQSGVITTDKMCVSCNYFRPRVHEGERPHHCALVDSPMADQHLRVDCAEHEAATPEQRQETWQRFTLS